MMKGRLEQYAIMNRREAISLCIHYRFTSKIKCIKAWQPEAFMGPRAA